jgi:hypothetical protein
VEGLRALGSNRIYLARAPIRTSRETDEERKEDKYTLFLIFYLLGDDSVVPSISSRGGVTQLTKTTYFKK